MPNLKRFSTILIVMPILFIGCTSEKTSLLKPQKPVKQELVLHASENLLQDKKLPIITHLRKDMQFTYEEDETVLNAHKTLTSQVLNLSTQWVPFTKEDEILETAKEFLGIKYIWAANGPTAFDCSGFTKYVFKQNGISLPRYSGHQANIGEKIAFENLEKGDLVFFDTTKKFRKKVNHVGIFIGDNKFIHASSGGKKVMITSFSKQKFYKKKFLYARRIIDVNDNIALNHMQKQVSSFN